MAEDVQPSATATLESYLANAFDLEAAGSELTLPLDDEPFVACWRAWEAEARTAGAWAVLEAHLPQLRFPIREGISRSEGYRAATLRGVPVDELSGATGLGADAPRQLELEVHATAAGHVPLLIARRRQDFVTLVRALGRRNEPAAVPDSMGALAIAGYNNWHRIHQLRRRWEESTPTERATATWGEEFARIRQRRELYQDRFILLSDGPYSGVPAAEMGLDEQEWRDLSLEIRREHECAHYFTRRVFGKMRNHLLDELIADYAGITAAVERFRADWLLRFLGLEDAAAGPSSGARLHIYRGEPPLDDEAYGAVQAMLRQAARSLEQFGDDHPTDVQTPYGRAIMVAAIAKMGIEALAAADAPGELRRAVRRLRSRWRWQGS